MTNAELLHPASGVTRVATVAAWIAAIGCLPYLVLKVFWTAGMPVGISDESVLEDNDWVLGNAVMAVVQLVALALVVALVRPWARRLPGWLLLFPAWVGTGLLFQIVAGAGLALMLSQTSPDSSGAADPFRPWVYVLVYSAFAVQGFALAVAFANHVTTRWGHLLGLRSGEATVERIRMRSWPENHLAEIAMVTAAMAVVTAAVFSFWSGGGAFGLSGTRSDPSRAMQLSRASGAVIAALGLFGVAGRLGGQIPFWVPAGLVWIGSGALVAFDGFSLMLNGLFALAGSDSMADATWQLTDTALVLKVLVGGLAAAVGVVAVRSAANITAGQNASRG